MGDTIIEQRFSGGRWAGRARFGEELSEAPSMGVFLREQDLGDAEVSHDIEDIWKIEFTIPTGELEEGPSTFLFVDRRTEEVLGRFCINAGVAVEQDVLVQLDALRAEVDHLKSAFRREMRRTAKDS